MTESPRADDPRLLSVAAAISDGVPVEWPQASPLADAETSAILDELRVIESVSRISGAIPNAWGPFAIRGEIGQGSYGTVYRAFDANLNLEVALKVIRPRVGLDGTDGSRGLNEARLLAQVTHPNVVRVYQAERVNQEIGLAMELVQGRTLKDLVHEHGPFSAREAMLTGVDVCCALAAVHGKKLVHGDVKAQNVMRATGGRTVLMDFGAGFDVKTDPSSSSRLEGTPMYLAPEVFAGGARTAVSDIYSVGVLLFYLATGSYPVDGRTRSDVRQRHLESAPRRLLRDVRPDLPDGFIRVVNRAMADHPHERYQTAGELEAALDRALQHDAPVPLPAPAPAPWLPPAWVLTAVGVLLVLAIALGYRAWTPSPTMSGAAAAPSTAGLALPSAAPGAPAGTAATDPYQIEAAFYREQGHSSVRLLSGARVAPGDRLSLRVTSSVPTYVYVVNEDDHGASFLLFPLPGQQVANPLPVGTRHEIPGIVHDERTFWTVSTAGGREHFLIFASPQPPTPAFERVFAGLPRPSAQTPVVAQPLPTDLAGMLRGVGGLTTAPTRPVGTPLNQEFGAPLPDAAETTRGVWVRQLTLDNPRR